MWIRDRDPWSGLGSEYVTSLVFLISLLCAHQSLSSGSRPHPRKKQEPWGSLRLQRSALLPKARREGARLWLLPPVSPLGTCRLVAAYPLLGWCPGRCGCHRCRTALTLGLHYCSVRSRAWLLILKHFHCVRALGPRVSGHGHSLPGHRPLPRLLP